MTAAARSRDALAEGMCARASGPCGTCQENADRLIDSGAVLDLAALAEDEAMVKRVRYAICREMPEGPIQQPHAAALETSFARAALAAVAEGGTR